MAWKTMPDSAWQSLPIRQQLIDWVDAKGIGWQRCGHYAQVGLMMGYRGQIYIDLPFDTTLPAFLALQAFLENSDDVVFKNTPRDIAHVLHQMGDARGARFEFECYDIGHLTMLRHFVDRGAVKPPYFIQFVFGVLGGMAAEPDTLTHLKRTADRLFGSDYLFSVLAAGRAQMPMATMAAAMGGHVRVGLEDSLYIDKGVLARSNAEQVARIRGIVEALGRTVASPDEARVMLGLKGRAEVGF